MCSPHLEKYIAPKNRRANQFAPTKKHIGDPIWELVSDITGLIFYFVDAECRFAELAVYDLRQIRVKPDFVLYGFYGGANGAVSVSLCTIKD